MRLLYVLLIYLVAPLVIAHEVWKALFNPEYRGRLRQRLGFVQRATRTGSVWIHAVSVGEVQAAAGLVSELQRRYPTLPIVLTTVTPTGAQRARSLFKEGVQICYLPYDLPGSVGRFLDRISPQVVVILETEIWPTLYHQLGQRRIPLLLGSARVSTRSVDRYRRMASLFRDTLSHGILIGAQTPADADRFRAIGAAPGRVQVTGNIKYDLKSPPRPSMPVAPCASDGERSGRSGSPAARTKAKKKLHWRRTQPCVPAIPIRCCCWCRVTRSASMRCARCCASAGCRMRSAARAPCRRRATRSS
ncbi:MAG: hypothetical protein IPJ97_05505 [Proteobacteria bacterium]|nr:hypothetical protein [Pseudomonadota bacterium]